MSYTKNSVKLLPIIEKFENNIVLYTEFDGNYNIGDKLYIMVIDNNSADYILDSFQSSGNTYNTIGYTLLKKDGNKLILNLTGITLTSLIPNNCYIGRIYIKSGLINRGTISGVLLYDVELNPTNNTNLVWYQGIITKSTNNINKINFNTNDNNLLLKSELLSSGVINSFYTINNYGNGLSLINLSGNTINLIDCNINAGLFNKCDLYGTGNTITNGILYDCNIGPTFIISGGELVNSNMQDNTINWINGVWNDSGNTTSFKSLIWNGGTWKNGLFTNTSSWLTGRFMKGIFNGINWSGGTFGTKNSTLIDTIFTGSTWYGGSFNGGTFSGSTWSGGTFNDGILTYSIWWDGILNNGEFTNSTWWNGIFNNGEFNGLIWYNGIFNNGTFSGSTWNNGSFNEGTFYQQSTWNNGHFYGGKFQDSIWNNGSFHKGSMFTSNWYDGDLFFGTMNDINWYGGTWHNGIANDIIFSGGTWNNGVFNIGSFNYGTWNNGSFNAGFFSGITSSGDTIWNNGIFYFGEFSGTWNNGTFYNGDIKTSIPQVNIIGKDFKQYNKTGLIWKNLEKPKLPAKRRF